MKNIKSGKNDFVITLSKERLRRSKTAATEDQIITAEEYSSADVDAAYWSGFEDGYEIAMREIAHDKHMKDGLRIERARDALQIKKEKSSQIIETAYKRLYNGGQLKNLSEEATARKIVDYLTPRKFSKNKIKTTLRESKNLKTYPWRA